jgi:hypothetical protein
MMNFFTVQLIYTDYVWTACILLHINLKIIATDSLNYVSLVAWHHLHYSILLFGLNTPNLLSHITVFNVVECRSIWITGKQIQSCEINVSFVIPAFPQILLGFIRMIERETMKYKIYTGLNNVWDRLCGLAVRVPGYRSKGPGSIPGTTRFSEK